MRNLRWIPLLVTLLASASSAAADLAWHNLSPVGDAPPGMRDFAFAYDSQRDQIITLGAGDSKTWFLDLADTPAWTSTSTASTPSGNLGAVYDPTSDRVVVVSSESAVYGLAMASPTSWTLLSPNGQSPPQRLFFSVARDELRNRLLLFGGGPSPELFNDVWALDLSGTLQWHLVQCSGTPPPPRWGAVSVYDSIHDRLIVLAGSSNGGYATSHDAWALTLSGTPTWEELQTGGTAPPSRMLASAVYDPMHDRVLLYGGYGPGGLGDTWELDLASYSWTELAPEAPLPAVRWSHAATYRSQVSSMILFGGFNGSNLSDSWELSWAPVAAPPAISSFSPVGGQVGDQVVVHGSNLSTVTLVQFDGVSAAISSKTLTDLTTTVPAGASTGPIRVTNPYGSATSTGDFFVGVVPILAAATPDSGRVGDSFELRGAHFTGSTSVQIGGTGSASFVVTSDTSMTVTVDSLATTGPIAVTTPAAAGTSSFSFLVLTDSPAPRLVSVRDVKPDQGGHVVLRWNRSDFDQPRYRSITGYRVWRRAPNEAAKAAVDAGNLDDKYMVRSTGKALEYWESVAELPAAFLRGYAYVAATTQDSSSWGFPYTAFFVQALTADRYTFYSSNVDSGYSVDDLAPPAPTPFAATFSTGSTSLHWGASRAPDVAVYRLYRGTSVSFVPTQANLIATTSDTSCTDSNGGMGFCYKLAAVDVHGNVGRYSVITPSGATATLSTFVSGEVTGGTARLAWYLSADELSAITVYRRAPDETWQPIGTAESDGDGFVRFVDATLVSGARLGYRLGVRPVNGDEFFSGEGWIDIPPSAVDAKVLLRNPVVGDDVAVTFTPPTSHSVRVDLFDLAGRVVSSQVVSGGTGRRTLSLARAASLTPGLYLVRVGLERPWVGRVAVIR